MAEETKPIVLGCEVKDKVSGFTGQVTIKHEMLGGNVMWAIQPPVVIKKDTEIKMPDAVSLDAHMLKRTGDGISAELPPIDTTCTIKPGEKVEDIITGYRGTATEKVTFQNGCVYFQVEGPLTQKLPENLPKAKLFLHSRLTRTATGVSNNERLVPPGNEKPSRRSPGGPMIRNTHAVYAR
jgi:hypothetical protein